MQQLYALSYGPPSLIELSIPIIFNLCRHMNQNVAARSRHLSMNNALACHRYIRQHLTL